MGWLEDTLASLQGGGAPPAFGPAASPFPDVAQPTAEQEAAAAAAAAAREAAGARLIRSNQRHTSRVPDLNDLSGAAVNLAMDQAPAGTGVPGQMPMGAPDGTPFGSPAPFGPGATIPPSVQLASQIAAPSPPQGGPPPVPGALPPPGAVPTPRPRPDGADGGDDAIPPNATPTQGGPAAASVAAPMGIPTAPGQAPIGAMQGISDLLRGVGGALSGDNGAATDSILKQRETKVLQAQQGNATARLLASKGATAPEIQAAISGGPETIKALLGQYMGKDKYAVTQTGEVEDQYGGKRKIFKIFNANDGTFKDIPADSAAEAKATAAASDAGGVPDLNDAQKNRVQAIIDGREPYPASSRAPDAAKIRAAVHATDPQFDAVNYKSREATRQKFTKGKGADNLTAFNTAIGHLGALEKSIDQLNNSGFPAWNKYVSNPIAEQFDPKYQTGLKNFQTARTAVADELTRAFRGSGGNVHDIIQWENAINAADSPAALKAAVRQAAELLGSRIDAVGDEYNRGMGTTKDPLELLNPKAAEAFKRIREGERTAAKPTATVKPGNYVWKNGALVPE